MPNQQWIMAAFKLSPSADTERLIMGLRAIATLGLVAVPLNYVVLKRLLAIVETVRAGDPFVAANASRLQAIAGALLALQLLSVVIGAIGKAISSPSPPFHLSASLVTFSGLSRSERNASDRPRRANEAQATHN